MYIHCEFVDEVQDHWVYYQNQFIIKDDGV